MFTKINSEKIQRKDHIKAPKIDDRLYCKFDTSIAHLYESPLMLPCRNTCCIDCLRRSLNAEGVLNCTLCGYEHLIQDISSLPADINIEALLFNNTYAINEVLYGEYRHLVNDFIERFNNRDQLVNNLFENIHSALDKRFNEIRLHFESLLKKCTDHLAVLKFNIKDSLNLMNAQVKKKMEDFKSFHAHMGQKLRNNFTDHDDLVDNDHTDASDGPSLLLKNCQSKINEVKELSDSFTRILHRVSFEPNDWRPEMFVNVGKLTPLPLTKIANSIRTSKPFQVPIERYMKDPHSLSIINSNLFAITDTILNSVFIFDDNYEFVRSVRGVGDRLFQRPTAICVDDVDDNLYLYDQGAKTLYITDKEISFVKKSIAEEFIQDLTFFDTNLVVLDRVNSTLKVCSNDGQVLTSNYLFNKTYSQFESKIIGEWLVKNPVRVGVIMNTIAILDSHSDIYIYDFDIKLKTIINSNSNGDIWSMTFLDKFIYTHSEDGSLTCYESTLLKNDYQLFYTPSYSRKMTYFLNFSWHMKSFNDKIIILSETLGRKVLVVV